MLVCGANLLCQKYTRYHWFCEGFRRLYNNYEKKIDVGFKCRPVHPNSDMPKLKKWFLQQVTRFIMSSLDFAAQNLSVFMNKYFVLTSFRN
jgi:hypothetical protein